MKYKRAIVIPDTHFPYQDNKAMSVVYKAIRMIKPSAFISLGDLTEGKSVSHWTWKKKKKPSLEYLLPMVDEEIKRVNSEIDRLQMHLDHVGVKERIVLEGNHDIWFNDFVESYPYLKGYTFKKAFKFDERGWKVIPHNEPFRYNNSKLVMIHGAFVNQHHAKKHAQTYMCNVLYGHTHDLQRHTITRYNENGEQAPIQALSLGCLKDMSREVNSFCKSLINWSHAFAIVDFYEDRNFKIEVVEVINGRTSLWGKIIHG